MGEAIRKRLVELGLAVSVAEAERLQTYVDLLMRWNRVHNLTAVRDRERLTRRHLAESLALKDALRGTRIADVGSGAGLPGIPLAVVHAERAFTLIESRAKRAAFLHHAISVLNLENVVVVRGRAEDLRSTAPFDTVLARAVAALPDVVAMTEHLLGEDSVLLVPTKAAFEAEKRAIGKEFRVSRVQAAGRDVLLGALVAIERARNEPLD